MLINKFLYLFGYIYNFFFFAKKKFFLYIFSVCRDKMTCKA